MTSSGLFTELFVPDAVREATSERAWIQAMLDAEAGLAAAEAGAGVIPPEAASTIASVCDAGRFDPAALARDARASGNPVVPLVRALTEAVPGNAGRFVHWGATSQDIMDTAAMLVARGARRLVDDELGAVVAACAALADRHRATPMAGRTLLQQALPTTFGLKAAVWLAGVAEGRGRLAQVPLAVELGGAAGTLASLGPNGVRVLELLAEELELEEPALPWHTVRVRLGELGAALALCAGALEKVALDVTLLAQTEVGEVAEPSDGGHGGSSTLPHKRNPVGAVLTVACARRARAAAGLLLGAMAQEHERATGAWQSEWEALAEALAMTGGAGWALRGVLEGLEVRTGRMRENLDMTGGLLMAESVTMSMAERMGRLEAKRLVEAACRRALDADRPLRDALVEDEEVSAVLSIDEIERALDPERYLGSADVFVDRALARYAEAGR